MRESSHPFFDRLELLEPGVAVAPRTQTTSVPRPPCTSSGVWGESRDLETQHSLRVLFRNLIVSAGDLA